MSQQWFRGELEGYYVGIPAGRPAVSQYGTASRFEMRIYRALIRHVEVLASDISVDEPSEDGDSAAPLPRPAPLSEIPDGCFYQAKIDDVRLLGVLPGACFEGAVYDVAVANMRITDETMKGGKRYGRIVGDIYGRYRLPETASAGPLDELELQREVSHEPTATHSRPRRSKIEHGDGNGDGNEDDESETALHPPTPPTEEDDRGTVTVAPFGLLAAMVAVALGLGASWSAAAIWIEAMLPIIIIRAILRYAESRVARWHLYGGAFFVLVQAVFVAFIVLDWWQVGCKTEHLFALIGVICCTLVTGLLPPAMPLLCTGAVLGGLLFMQESPRVGDACATDEEPGEPVAAPPRGRPSLTHPGAPRTNRDGSWPRRPPPALP